MKGNAGDQMVVAIARRRHGIVAIGELYGAGLTRHAVAGRGASGWLTRLHRGVFVVGAAVSEWTDEAAALVACGLQAALSHRSAGALWAMRPRGDAEPVEVSVDAARAPRGHDGVRVHRTRLGR